MVTDNKGVELVEGLKVTLADGAEGIVRGVHEGGCTVWMDAEKKEEGEIRTIGENECTVIA